MLCIHAVHMMTFSDHILWPKELWAAVLATEHRPLYFHTQVAGDLHVEAHPEPHFTSAEAEPLLQAPGASLQGTPIPSAPLNSSALPLRTVLFRVSCRLNIFKWIWILQITEQQQEQKEIQWQKSVSLFQLLYLPWIDFSISFLNFN